MDLLQAVRATLQRFSLKFENMSGIVTDGVPSMIEEKNGLAKLVNDCAKKAGNMRLKKHHCILHQENLCAEILKMENVTNVVLKIVKSKHTNNKIDNFKKQICVTIRFQKIVKTLIN